MNSYNNLDNPSVKFIARIRSPIKFEFVERDEKERKHNRYSSTDIKYTENFHIKNTLSSPVNTSYISTKENPFNNYEMLTTQQACTVFTLPHENNKKLIITTQKPLSVKFINTNLTNEQDLQENKNFLIQNYGSSFFGYDSVYTEMDSLDTLYIEQVRENISNLFLGKNSCVILFGPSNSGKSYILKGIYLKNGVLSRTVEDIFNYIDDTSKMHKLRMSIYLTQRNDLIDLLATNTNRRIVKANNELNKILIKSKSEFEVCLSQAMEHLSGYGGKNIIKPNLIFSFYIEDNTSRKIISQLDFVELASSEFGFENNIESGANSNYGNPGKGKYPFSPQLSTISNDFNSIGFILSNTEFNTGNTKTVNDSVLISALSNTIRSNILFITCLIPNENPPEESFKALNYVALIKSQIAENMDNSNKQYINNNKGKTKINKQLRTNILEKEYREDTQAVNSNVNTEQEIDYINSKSKDMLIEDHLNELNKINNLSPTKTNKYHSSIHENLSEGLQQEISMLKQLKRKIKENKNGNTRKNFKPNNNNTIQVLNTVNSANSNMDQVNNGTVSNNLAGNKKLTDLEKTLRKNEAKIEMLNRNMENLINSQSGSQNLSYYNSGYNNMEYEQLRQENITLKADTLIFREDVNHLTEVNKNLDQELTQFRKKNIDLIQENEHLHRELIQKQLETERLTEAITKLRLFDNPGLEAALESRHTKDTKIKELEYDLKQARDEKSKIEIEYRILLERYSELKNNYSNLAEELQNSKKIENEEINSLENKIEKLSKELEFFSKENKQMRLTDEKCRSELTNMKKALEKVQEKYLKKKELFGANLTKISDLENNLRALLIEKQIEEAGRKKVEEDKKIKIDQKQKILEDMQNRIQGYKSVIIKGRLTSNLKKE